MIDHSKSNLTFFCPGALVGGRRDGRAALFGLSDFGWDNNGMMAALVVVVIVVVATRELNKAGEGKY